MAYIINYNLCPQSLTNLFKNAIPYSTLTTNKTAVKTRNEPRNREKRKRGKEMSQEELTKQEELIELRRHFHSHPEAPWHEDQTLSFIETWVNGHFLRDFLYLRRGKGGIWFDFIVQPEQPFVIFRADVDALKVQEINEVTYKSQNPGVMHACGHDCHTAIMMVAMREIIEQHRHNPSFPACNIRVVFQRAEEDYTAKDGSGGRVLVFEDGVCENVRAAIALHVWSQKPSGEFWTRPGSFLVNSDRAELTIRTKGGHAGFPHKAENALDYLFDLPALFRNISQRRVAFEDGPVIINNTVCHAGGDLSSANVVPIEAKLGWSIRTGTIAARSAVRQEMTEIIKRHLDGRVDSFEFRWVDGHPATTNDPKLVAKTAEIIGDDDANADHPIIPGGEDFGHYAQKVPSVMWMLGTGSLKGKTDISHHCPNFDVDESVLWKGVEFWLKMAGSKAI